ncbi:hypothetical protein BD289DRAFT_433374 [Coniella lustricola]|uniref:Uncharacterized protein n=1 Tax=Coniella lustricola TaxID=2025994 RepID=A0A2T3A8Q0_9PEZI|nr:hypothetical protein BD289DRAFT_433374 [Coniella lustricola]
MQHQRFSFILTTAGLVLGSPTNHIARQEAEIAPGTYAITCDTSTPLLYGCSGPDFRYACSNGGFQVVLCTGGCTMNNGIPQCGGTVETWFSGLNGSASYNLTHVTAYANVIEGGNNKSVNYNLEASSSASF